MCSDYLDRYVSYGGSTVKIVLADEAGRRKFADLLAERARQMGYIYASVNSAETRVHKLEDLYFAVSRRLDWLSLGRRFLETVLFPRFDLPADGLSIEALARKNNQERWMVQRNVDQLMHSRLVRRKGLSGEFRRAIFSIVGSLLSPVSLVTNTTPHVLDWLTGRLNNISLVKPAMLYRRITKTNGRQMLTSLSRWLRDSGIPGLVLTIDISAVTASTRSNITFNYTRAAALDCFEVIRQFIDSVDLVEGLALWFVADDAFANDQRRGISNYPALEMRLAEDIHDSVRPNPFAPMVRIG
jgi:hypothetical protein